MSENYKELEETYANLRWNYHNLELEYKDKMTVLNQIWGLPVNEPIAQELRITPELADIIIKNMQKIKERGGESR